MSDADTAVIQAVLDGDSERYRELVARYSAAVGNYIYRMIPNAADREEVCQDVFVKAYVNLSQFRFEAKFTTWLYTIAYRQAIEHLRKNRLETVTLDGHDISSAEDLDAAHSKQESAKQVRDQIKRLTTEEQTVLTLYHYQEMGLAEIGQIVGKPEGTIKSDLFRIRKKLKQGLQRQFAIRAGVDYQDKVSI
ncbi:MAG: RNA polymerase sigma factor [Pseudomonas sp.]|uniref:RNA polymerase sigma factor n=1 Tax=SAR86 cluster bacterium TaxID=2030880 RepID=A0A972VV27_9GAMM|nr:RNA polymerase sigma factor [SAR86 cluster bacterium]